MNAAFQMKYCMGPNSAIFHLRFFGCAGIWTWVTLLRSRHSIHYSTISCSKLYQYLMWWNLIRKWTKIVMWYFGLSPHSTMCHWVTLTQPSPKCVTHYLNGPIPKLTKTTEYTVLVLELLKPQTFIDNFFLSYVMRSFGIHCLILIRKIILWMAKEIWM